MQMPVDRITIEGFKSIRKLDNFELRPLNVLIGANGSGKSNFVSVFRLLREMMAEQLQLHLRRSGGASAFLFGGPKLTRTIAARFEMGPNTYEFRLDRTVDDAFAFASESVAYRGTNPKTGRPYKRPYSEDLGQGHTEARLRQRSRTVSEFNPPAPSIAAHVFEAVTSWTVYHFHDTSNEAGIRGARPVRHDQVLHHDASNLAAFLLRLRTKEPGLYSLIRDVIRQSVPFLDDFVLTPRTEGADPLVMLEWKQIGCEYSFHPTQLSDGSIRFIALVTALMQPDPPKTILIDEPELGLHPDALSVIAGLLSSASTSTQVIVSTQSALLVDKFEPEDIIVVEREDGASTFRRLAKASLSGWLDRYSLGELWQKNTFGGGPKHE